jgi:hypothetical protein
VTSALKPTAAALNGLGDVSSVTQEMELWVLAAGTDEAATTRGAAAPKAMPPAAASRHRSHRASSLPCLPERRDSGTR